MADPGGKLPDQGNAGSTATQMELSALQGMMVSASRVTSLVRCTNGCVGPSNLLLIAARMTSALRVWRNYPWTMALTIAITAVVIMTMASSFVTVSAAPAVRRFQWIPVSAVSGKVSCH